VRPNSLCTDLSLIIFCSEAQAKRGEEAEVDPEQFQDPDNEYGLFAGTTYEQDDEEADKIYDEVDQNMDSRVGHAGVFSVSYVISLYSTTSLCLSIQGARENAETC